MMGQEDRFQEIPFYCIISLSNQSFSVSAIVDALSDPKKFLTIAEKRADQMKALGIDTVLHNQQKVLITSWIEN